MKDGTLNCLILRTHAWSLVPSESLGFLLQSFIPSPQSFVVACRRGNVFILEKMLDVDGIKYDEHETFVAAVNGFNLNIIPLLLKRSNKKDLSEVMISLIKNGLTDTKTLGMLLEDPRVDPRYQNHLALRLTMRVPRQRDILRLLLQDKRIDVKQWEWTLSFPTS